MRKIKQILEIFLFDKFSIPIKSIKNVKPENKSLCSGQVLHCPYNYEQTKLIIKEMVDWDRRKRNLEDWKWKVMNDVVTGKKQLSDTYKYTFWLNLQFLRKKGFPK